MKPLSSTKTPLVGVLQGVMVGTHLLIARHLGSSTNPVVYAWSYLVAANAVLCAYLLLQGSWYPVHAALQRWPCLVAVGLINVGIQVCTVHGVALSGAASASVLVRTDLLFGLILVRLVYGERSRLGELVGGGLMVWGVLMVMRISATDLRGGVTGDVYLLLAGLLTALNAMLIKYGLKGVWGPTVAYFNTLVAGLALTGFGLVSGQWSAWTAAFGARSGWLCLAGLNYALSLLAYYFILQYYPVWMARSFALVSPVVAIAGGWLWFGEQMMWQQVVGVIVVMLGMGVMLGQRARQTSPKPAARLKQAAGAASTAER